MTLNDKICYGISSRTLDDKHIVMVDADIPKEQYPNFLVALKELQKDYQLSDFYIFMTKHGFNAFTLDKVELGFLTGMLCTQPIIDTLFIYFNDLREYYTLKFNSDKHFIKTLESVSIVHEKSYAHFLFFNDILEIPMYKDNLFDDNKVFEIINY